MSSTETQVKLVNKDDYKPSASELSHNAAKRMNQQAAKTDSTAVHHVADVMKAQDKLVSDKDLDKRLARIAKLTKEVRKRSPEDYKVMQRQVEDLKPLLRQAVESSGFRESIIGLLRTFEQVFKVRKDEIKQKADTAKEKVKDKTTKDSDKHKDKAKDDSSKKDSEKHKDKAKDDSSKKDSYKHQEKTKDRHYETEVNTSVVLPAPTLPREASQQIHAVPHPQQHPVGFAPAPPSSYPPTVVHPSQHAKSSTTTTLNEELHHGKESIQKNEEYKKQKEQNLLTDKQWKKIEDGLHEFLTEVQKHPEYRKGVNQLFDIAATFDVDMINTHDSALLKLRSETRDLIAQFSGEDVLQRLFDNIEDLAKLLDDNDEAQEWWVDFRDGFKRLLKNYHGREDLRSARGHFDKVPHIFNKERKKINKILHLLGEVFQNLKNDEYVKSLRNKIAILGDDLYYTDSDGRKHFDLNAVRDITGAIVDILKKELKNIDLPDIKGEDQKGSFSFKKLHIKTRFPSKIKFNMDTELVERESKKTGKTKYRARFILHTTIKHIRVSAKNVHFAFKRRGLSDSGILDVNVPSASLYIDFIFAPAKNPEALKGPTRERLSDSNTEEYNFSAVQSTFRITDIEINYHKDTMSHNILVPLATRFAKRNLINNLQTSIEKTIDQRAETMGNNMAKSFANSPLPFSFGSEAPKKHHHETAE